MSEWMPSPSWYEGEKIRLIAWSRELVGMHERLREALRVTQAELEDGRFTGEGGNPPGPASRDLLLFCHGFCIALAGHHEGEGDILFPAIAAEYPELGETLLNLQQDHSLIAHLLAALQDALDHAASPAELNRHLDGISAIMESHFRYEERSLLAVLNGLALDADISDVLGPL